MSLDTLEKVHKMRDERWTVKDKLTQYRGIINLYARDRKNIEADTQKIRRTNYREIRKLKGDVQYYREALTNATSGDKQRLRNALQHHRLYLLAYEDRRPSEVAENIFQINFTKTKVIGNLDNKIRQRNYQFFKLKMEQKELEDRSREDVTDNGRRKEQVIANKIEFMKIKRRAATAIKESYQKILDYLKRDSLFFERVLIFLHSDQANQMKCVLQATEMGQLATEDLYNLRQEYKAFEKEVKASMRMRDKQVRKLKEEVDNVFSECRVLTRTESDIELPPTDLPPTESEAALPLELAKLEETLEHVKAVTLVTDFDEIYPQMRNQIFQKDRLWDQLMEVRNKYDEKTKQRNHGELVLETLRGNMGEDATKFREDRKKYLSDIGAAIIKRDAYNEEVRRIGGLLLLLRSSLQTIYKLLDRVKDPDNIDDDSDYDDVDSTSYLGIPEPLEEDAEFLLSLISEKVDNLMMQFGNRTMTSTEALKAKQVFERGIADKLVDKLAQEIDQYDQPLIVETGVEDAMVVTREIVKERSAQIVEQFTRPLELSDVPRMKTLKKKKNSKWM